MITRNRWRTRRVVLSLVCALSATCLVVPGAARASGDPGSTDPTSHARSVNQLGLDLFRQWDIRVELVNKSCHDLILASSPGETSIFHAKYKQNPPTRIPARGTATIHVHGNLGGNADVNLRLSYHDEADRDGTPVRLLAYWDGMTFDMWGLPQTWHSRDLVGSASAVAHFSRVRVLNVRWEVKDGHDLTLQRQFPAGNCIFADANYYNQHHAARGY